MQGHIRKRTHTTKLGKQTVNWYVVIDLPRDAADKRRQKWYGGFRTRAAAEVGRAKIVAELHDGTHSKIDLTKDELLVLFECLHRICETNIVAISHHAEAVVIDKLAGQLERGLAEPFKVGYQQVLQAARDDILDRYRERMGDHAWVEQLALDQR